MRRRCAVLCLLLCPATLFADEPAQWGQSGDWTIWIDPTVGHGCYMARTYDDETVILIGTVPSRRGGFLAAHNANWTDIQDGVEGVLRIDFGDAVFEGSVVGRTYDGKPGGYAFFDNPSFVDEFRKRNSLVLTGKKSGYRVEIDLKDSNNGIDTVLACQKEQPSG